MQALLTKIGKVGHVEGDDVELKIKKSFVVYLAIFMSVGGLVWGGICLFYDLTLPSFIPFGYLVISFFNIIYFKLTKNFSVVRFVQIFISLSLPVAFQWVLGGFSSSGNIILWSLLSLIASLSFVSTQSSIRWLVFFALMVICSVIFDDQAKAFKPDILPESSAVFFGVNIVMISSIVFGLVTFFVSQYDKAKKEIEVKNLQIVRVAKKVKASYLELQSAHERLKNEVASGVTNEAALENYESILKSQKALIDSFSRKRN